MNGADDFARTHRNLLIIVAVIAAAVWIAIMAYAFSMSSNENGMTVVTFAKKAFLVMFGMTLMFLAQWAVELIGPRTITPRLDEADRITNKLNTVSDKPLTAQEAQLAGDILKSTTARIAVMLLGGVLFGLWL